MFLRDYFRLFPWMVFIGAILCRGAEVPITILHTTDLHGTILPITDYQGNTNVGGMARCAWMIHKIRSEEKNVLLVDAGDLYQGSAVAYLTDGAIMIKGLNALQYDSWTLGNHEFDWGIEKIGARITEAQVPVLAANLHHTPSLKTPNLITEAFQKIQPFIVRKFNGVKLGIVGLDTPGIPDWSRPRLIPGIRLEDSVSALKRVIPQMKAAHCDILVLVTHQGIHESGDDHANQLFAISRAFPELDVIIGGHTHQLRPYQMMNGILYSQANYWGTYLGRVDLLYDTDQHKLIKKRSCAIPMDSAVPFDADFIKMLQPDLDRTERFLNTRIGEATDRINSIMGPKHETPIFNLLCASITEAVQSQGGTVDAVLHGILNNRAELAPGPITMKDVFTIVPYENTIGVAELTREQLMEILEENASAYQAGSFRGLWGMTMKLNPSAPRGKRVVFIGNRDGTSIPPHSRLKVAFNSFDLASAGTRLKRLREIVDQPEARLIEYNFQTRDAVIEYIRMHSPLKAKHNGWWNIDRKHQNGLLAP